MQGGASALSSDPEVTCHRDACDAAFPKALGKLGSSGEATYGAPVRRCCLHDSRQRAGFGVVIEQGRHCRTQGQREVVRPDEQLIETVDGSAISSTDPGPRPDSIITAHRLC